MDESNNNNGDDRNDNSGRLSTFIRPTHYDLKYTTVDLVRHVFEGTVTIDLDVSAAATTTTTTKSNSIELHSLELQHTSAKLMYVTKEGKKDDISQNKHISSWDAIEFRYHVPNQTVTISFDDTFPGWDNQNQKHKYQLTIHFSGILNDQMRGFYRSTYTNGNSNSNSNHKTTTHTMATTQFEPTDARRAFPCFDEPAFKATFQLTITIPFNLQCISNTTFESVHTLTHNNNNNNNDDDDTVALKTITFAKTPKMSTYLLAFVIGHFDAISRVSNGIQTTIYTVPGKAHQGHFCLDTAVQCLDLYQDLFSIPYPLVKSDLLAIPDFAAGAMENWGCVTYREAKILVKEGSTSESTRRGIARTVCHELAHQWFGNLVTMEFWTQLWLNEGFARYMEFVGIDTIYPQWDAWTEFVQSVYGMALSLDSMKSSHPVEVEVHHPDEINDIFDAISYAKGASLIRMISSYVGFQTFIDGLKIYLKRHAYGNATTEMLWAALEEASQQPVGKMMTPWTSQIGYPLLILQPDNSSILTPRFLASGPSNNDDQTETALSWPIPVTAIVHGEDLIQGPWMLNGPDGVDDTSVLLENIKKWDAEGKWFKLNADQTAFYRVCYTDDQWKRLEQAAMSPPGDDHNADGRGHGRRLSAIDRLGLISDSFANGRAGYSSIVDSLKLVANFGSYHAAEYAVWQELSENIGNLVSLYRSESFFPKFQEFVRGMYSKQMELLGWTAQPGENQRTGTLRGTIISILTSAGDQAVLETSSQWFAAYAKGEREIPGDLRRIVFKAALRFDELNPDSDGSTFDTLKQLYEQSSFPEDQRNYLAVIGSVKDMKKHREILDYTLFSGSVRLQDIVFPLNALSSSSDEGGRACWAYFKDNYTKMQETFEDGRMWAAVVGLSCKGLRTLAEADEVESFFESKPPGSAKRRLVQALENIRTRALRLSRDRNAVAAFLSESLPLK